MSCEICRRSSCTRSFHSLEEQSEFDRENRVEEVKQRIRDALERRVNRLPNIWDEEEEPHVKLSAVLDLIQDI